MLLYNVETMHFAHNKLYSHLIICVNPFVTPFTESCRNKFKVNLNKFKVNLNKFKVNLNKISFIMEE
jgi:hypothetical protein